MRPVSQSPLLSIIINNYNYGRFLGEAINSALRQTYHPVEVIVVDDGSTDDSREVIQAFADRILPVFKENGGQASALNAGFTRSQGEVIIFLDSDDVLAEDISRLAVEAFRDRPGAAKIQYRMEIVDTFGRRTGKLKPEAHLPLLRGDLRRQVLTFPFDLAWMPTSGNAFGTHVLRQIFPIPEEDYPILADFYLSHLTPLFGRVAFLDQTGAYYRVHGSNHYQLSHPSIDLDTIRKTIRYWRNTEGYIKNFAVALDLFDPSDQATSLLSVADIANRLVSLKLDPANHPFLKDTRWALVGLGVKAAFQRFDIHWPMKFLFGLWFAAMVLVPSPIDRWLAELFFFPEKRGLLNGWLKRLHLARIEPPTISK